MRLGTLATGGGATSAVVVLPDGAAPVPGYADVGALLQDGPAGIAAAESAQAGGLPQAFSFTDLRCPVLAPGAVVCVGLNYRAHILEMGRELPTCPTLFTKLPRALTDPFADVQLSALSDRFDYEGELAVVIGRAGHAIPVHEAWSYVAGLTVLNDVTARDFQRRSLQWFAGKTFGASTPMGPWIVTPDELGDISASELRVSVNGEPRQHAVLGDLVFDVPTLVADLSAIVELRPGDIIATGTCGGVGDARGIYLTDGDVVEVEIDGIGVIANVFRTAA